MKAVFLNDNYQIERVYPEALRGAMAGLMDLHPDAIRSDELAENAGILRGAEAAFSTWGMPALEREQIERYLPNLRIVFYAAGSVQYFARPFLARGVRVASAWAANAIPVAEFSASMIRLCLKGFFPAHSAARQDWWGAQALVRRHPGCYKSTVGLLGLGMIGRGVAERFKGSGVRIVAYDPYAPASLFESLGARRADTLPDVFSSCDVVSNHLANLPATQEILRYEHFGAMKEYGAFVNTGRNAQVHVPGLVRAFTEVPTRTAVFDVTDPDEPPQPDNPLLALPNAYITPHMAGASGNEVWRMAESMVDEFKRYAAGKKLKWEVTEKMLETMA
jgi:phosphoglycerate dehydrogenase-like enzyme